MIRERDYAGKCPECGAALYVGDFHSCYFRALLRQNRAAWDHKERWAKRCPRWLWHRLPNGLRRKLLGK